MRSETASRTTVSKGGARALRAGAALLALAGLLGALAAVALAAKGDTILISRQSQSAGGAGANEESINSSTSATGRYVAFRSAASNLSVAADGAYYNVFVRDTKTGRTTLVSRRSQSAGGAGANDSSFYPSISADGRFVAFSSDADNLSGADDDNVENVFVRDVKTGRTTLVSRRSQSAGGAGANDSSYRPSISADGRYVAFSSNADNLSGADDDAYSDVFVRDTTTGRTTLVSRRSQSAGGAGADGNSSFPSISADGRYVAFSSNADNLSGADDNSYYNIFVRDTKTGRTTLVSRASQSAGGAGADDNSSPPSISADGRYVAFSSGADNLGGVYDNDYQNVFVRDVKTGQTTLVSRRSQSAGGAGADDSSVSPSTSADGRFIAFRSDADNLSGADDNDYQNIFVRDVKTGRTTLVSRRSQSAGGAGASDNSSVPSISADGRFIGFLSDADNLSGADDNNVTNVFRRDVLGP